MSSQKTWGGRFSEAPNELAREYNASLNFDRRLALVDIRGSLAHVRMLGARGILPEKEAEIIENGLLQVQGELEAGTFPFREEYEDIHMNVEARLTEIVGPVGGKLHTGRSRNDQVATDLRLWCLEELGRLKALLRDYRRILLDEADKALDRELILPGYTHLQRAMPVMLAHWFLAWQEMASRDEARVQDAMKRVGECPLGAAALAGTGFPIDRHQTAKELGFSGPMRNSLDAVASRDFVQEVLSALQITQTHLSRLSEELILYSSFEFGFVTISDAFATGSSIMPQKKNPDIPELIRAKAGRVLGSLTTISSVLKSLPLAYNKDLQEDKEPLFDAMDTVQSSVRLMAALLPGLTWHRKPMLKAAKSGFSLATELADWLASKGLPFREAHHVVGAIVKHCVQEECELSDLSLETLKKFHALFTEDALRLTSMETAIHQRASYGGTAPEVVKKALAEVRSTLNLK